MPKMDGIPVLGALRASGFSVPTLMLTTFYEHELVLQYMKLGALGYLRKDENLDELVSAIESIAAGKKWIQPAVTMQVQYNLPAIGANEFNTCTPLIEPLTEN